MRLPLCLTLAFGLLLLGTAAAAAGVCEELSYQRNAIYKAAGYCFKTAAQIRIFGNAGCQYDDMGDVPLSTRDRADVAGILRQEREAGCGEHHDAQHDHAGHAVAGPRAGAGA